MFSHSAAPCKAVLQHVLLDPSPDTWRLRRHPPDTWQPRHLVLEARGSLHLVLEARGSLHPPRRLAAPHLGHVAVAARHLDTRRKLHLTSRDVWRCRVSPTAACSSCRLDSLLLTAAALGLNTGAAPPSSATALCSVGPAPALAADWGPGSPPPGSGGAPPHHLTGQGTLVRLLSSPPRRYGTIRPEVRLLGQTVETGVEVGSPASEGSVREKSCYRHELDICDSSSQLLSGTRTLQHAPALPSR